MTQPKPGRNSRGKWITNDATARQAIVAIIAALDVLGGLAWMHTDQRAEYEGHIATAKAAAGLVDAGERPATDNLTHSP